MHVAFCLYPLYLEAVHIIPTVTRYTLVVSLPLSTPAPLPVAKMLTLSSRTTAMRPAPKPSAHSIRHLALRGAPRVSTRAAAPDGVGMSPELRANIDNLIASNKVVVFMKGTKAFPQCGFSNTVVQILNVMSVPFESVNILEDDRLRTGMKEYSQWPTFPQVYINGEFFGGCDIMIEAYQSGELKEQLEVALNS